MMRRKFPGPQFLPRVLLYDNNCRMYRHLDAQGETLHHEIGLPVDVFHWKCKHKKSDEACQVHCNPYNYPEILGEDGQSWFFNSSIAEQTNVWFGGYHAIVREMSASKYDFFLDEMIKEKNKITRSRLIAQGCLPGYRSMNFAPQ